MGKSGNVYCGHYTENIRKTIPFYKEHIHPTDMVALDYDCFTNNPCLIDQYQFINIFVVSLRGNVACITEHPSFKAWEAEFNSGELWTFLGESWVDQLPRHNNSAE